MPHVTATLELPDRLIASLRDQADRSDKNLALKAVIALCRGMLTRTYLNRGYARVAIASACASQAVTCSQADAVDNTDTITIAGTTLSVVAAPSTTAQFAKGSSNSAFATNLANAVNANATLQKLVRASASAAVCTITCVYPGPIGNLVALSEVGNGMSLGGATLASGASDEVDGYDFGYAPSV